MGTPKKVTAKTDVKVTSGVKAKVTSKPKSSPASKPPASKPVVKKKSSDSDVEAAVDNMMGEIDENEYSTSGVPQEITIEFLQGIVSGCQERIQTIKHEMGNDEEEDEEVSGDEADDDPIVDED
jgi:hypothetical protein